MVVVAPAEPQHVEALAALLAEMERFYGATQVEPLDQRIRQITDALFGDVPAAYALLAWDDAQLVGLAAYSFVWPAAGFTRSLYLKDLFLVEGHRRRGIGKLLMESLFDIAERYHCSRVEWTADRDSAEAQRFYEALGVPVNKSKLFYRRKLD
ncbi:MAG TPA: GNAT family N-acetyltransferase [Actinomycetota bacterium]|nr:GNAT family N-acetyltransferase [Actinomycetota bacterium]